MIEQRQGVFVYIFGKEDGRSKEERMELAVKDYCNSCSLNFEFEITDMQEVLRVDRTERGKPYFAKCPKIHFSISHSGAYWVIALADEQVGIDIQEHVRLKYETIEEAGIRFQKLAHRFFHPVEAKFVEWNSYEHFFTVWTAKESYVKYTGQGIDDSFSEQCVIPVEENLWNIFENKENVAWQAQGAWLCKVSCYEGYTLCVCTKQKEDIVLKLKYN